MKFTVYDVKGKINYHGVEIETLQDLQELQTVYESQLIIDFEDMEITIYNDYIEQAGKSRLFFLSILLKFLT